MKKPPLKRIVNDSVWKYIWIYNNNSVRKIIDKSSNFIVRKIIDKSTWDVVNVSIFNSLRRNVINCISDLINEMNA